MVYVYFKVYRETKRLQATAKISIGDLKSSDDPNFGGKRNPSNATYRLTVEVITAEKKDPSLVPHSAASPPKPQDPLILAPRPSTVSRLELPGSTKRK